MFFCLCAFSSIVSVWKGRPWMGNHLPWLTTHRTWNSHKGMFTDTVKKKLCQKVNWISSCLKYMEWQYIRYWALENKYSNLTASVVAMITWVMMTIDRVLTAAQATTASPTTPTSPWSLTRRAGAQSVARWSRGSRLSMLRRWAASLFVWKYKG